MRILVTGSAGFLGRHTVPALRAHFSGVEVIGTTHSDFDLTQPAAVENMFRQHKPDVVVHLAGYVGGIGANRAYPADFYYRNTLITALVFHQAAQSGVQKLVYPFGGCSYPAKAASPIAEDQLWQGYPQPESAPYSTAKMMGVVASESYRKQYGLNSIPLIPGNMYGEYDNFRQHESHVVPALVRRVHEARESGAEQIVAWGSGKPVRDFVYAGDVARLIPWFIENYDSSQPVNLSSGVATPIRTLTETVCRLSDFGGSLEWDASKPDGQMVKVFDVSRMRSLGLDCPTPLEEGLRRTISWYREHNAAGTDGIRL